jgi:hypothetical protein
MAERRSFKNVVSPFAGGVGICDGFQADDVNPTLLAETPFADSSQWSRFVADQGHAFDALRKALLPAVVERARAANDCYAEGGLTGTVIAELVVFIEADEARAAVSRAEVRQLQGDPARVAAARRCFESELLRRLPIRVDNKGPLGWPVYRGIYPKPLTLYLGPEVGLFNGEPQN